MNGYSYLVVLPELPVADTGGGVLLREVLHQLAGRGIVHVVVPVLPHQFSLLQQLEIDLKGVAASWMRLEPVKSFGKKGYSIRRLASGLPGGIYNFATPENEQRLADERRRVQPARELAISTWAAAAYPDRLFTPQTHLYLVNVDHEIVGAAPANFLRRVDAVLERRRVRKYCICGVRSAGKVAAITARDAEVLRALSGRADIQVVPPLMRPQPVGRDQVAPGSVLLPTNFTYPHNRASLRWFLDEVWPALDRETTLWVTGRDDSVGGLRSLCQRYERVEYLGCLPQVDLEQRFAREPCV